MSWCCLYYASVHAFYTLSIFEIRHNVTSVDCIFQVSYYKMHMYCVESWQNMCVLWLLAVLYGIYQKYITSNLKIEQCTLITSYHVSLLNKSINIWKLCCARWLMIYLFIYCLLVLVCFCSCMQDWNWRANLRDWHHIETGSHTLIYLTFSRFVET